MTAPNPAGPTTPNVTYGHASEIGSRDSQEDAYDMARHLDESGGYVVAAVADGGGSHLIADAAVKAVCALGATADYQFDPEQLITLAAAVLPLHAEYADVERWRIFEQFTYGDAYGHRTNATVAVVTIGPDSSVCAGWLGDCRVYVRVADGRLIQLTQDHLGKIGRPDKLTRSLATPGEGPQRAMWSPTGGPKHTPIQVLLTTDGVHEAIPHRAIRYALEHAPNSQRAARWLTTWAVRAAGRDADNATAIVLGIAH
ncbi:MULTISPECIES: PP2C family protein-serine/threonine phosphatase [Nocardia]|uniref:PP2C family protein-serine/threonine phosphatase n=1 Tax=Nocardia TaxID=1817 RepID=UPI0024544129|nr:MULTISPECIES: protein phosphatase 2C domain-containing protein [Nocardia]